MEAPAALLEAPAALLEAQAALLEAQAALLEVALLRHPSIQKQSHWWTMATAADLLTSRRPGNRFRSSNQAPGLICLVVGQKFASHTMTECCQVLIFALSRSL